MATHERVAASWRFGRRAVGPNMRTDGESVWSWGHRIGITSPDGKKIGFCCHYSQSTAEHSGMVCREADQAMGCELHERLALHRDRNPYVQKDYGAPCEGGELGPKAAWLAHPDALCVFRCLRCSLWHEGKCTTFVDGLDPRHQHGRSSSEDSADHQLRYQCVKCEARVLAADASKAKKALKRADTREKWERAFAILALPKRDDTYHPDTWSSERANDARMHRFQNFPVICMECLTPALDQALAESIPL